MRLHFQDELREQSPAYDDCPDFCGNNQTKSKDYCESCPTKYKQDKFYRELEEALDKEIGEEWKVYDLFYLLRVARDVEELLETDKQQWTVTTAELVRAYRMVESKKLREEHYAKMQELEALANK